MMLMNSAIFIVLIIPFISATDSFGFGFELFKF